MTDLAGHHSGGGSEFAGEVRKLTLNAKKIAVGKRAYRSSASGHDAHRPARADKRGIESLFGRPIEHSFVVWHEFIASYSYTDTKRVVKSVDNSSGKPVLRRGVRALYRWGTPEGRNGEASPSAVPVRHTRGPHR